MDGWRRILCISMLIKMCVTQFSDPYIADDVDIAPDSIQSFSSQLDVPVEYNGATIFGIIDRHGCTSYTFSVDKQVDERNITLQIHNNFNANNNDDECTVYWGDGKSDHVLVVDIGNPQIHYYTKFGVYQIYLRCPPQYEIPECQISISRCLQTSDFFDDSYRSLQNPSIHFSHNNLKLESYMELEDTSCKQPNIVWKITNLLTGEDVPIHQSGNSVLYISPGTLASGEYLIILYVSFPEVNPNRQAEDYIIIKIVHPELITHINGGEVVSVTHGQEILIDASESHDPSDNLATNGLVIQWSLVYYTGIIAYETFVVYYPDKSLPGGGTGRQILDGSDYALKINTTSLPSTSTVVVIFTMSRSSRVSSAMQVVLVDTLNIPLSLSCVSNCHIGRERLFYYDKIYVDSVFPDDFDTRGLSYSWEVRIWNETSKLFDLPTPAASLQTKKSDPALGIISDPVEGMVYNLSLTVSIADKIGKAQLIRTANYLPYNGTCVLQNTTVVSARDWVGLSCVSWKDNDYRKTKNIALDTNPILTYTVIQRTVGAVVYEEPILVTQSEHSHVILKVGDPADGYRTIICVRVTDVFNDYAGIEIEVVSTPAFDVSSVTPTEDGANVVAVYTEVDYVYDEQRLRDMGKNDMIISLVSAVCSNIHLVELPIWTPPAPRVLNTDGAVLDLKADGNTDIGSFEEALTASDNIYVDPATLKIQEVMQNLSKLIQDVVEEDIVRGTRQNDRVLTSFITNAFVNIVSKEHFINSEGKISVIVVGEFVGMDALATANSTEDESVQIETAAGEIYRMFQASVNSVVPDDLRENRPVSDLLTGRAQIDEMLTALGQNISLYDAKMSPIERAYLYRKMQLSLRYNTNDKMNASKKAAASAIVLAREIQSRLKLCSTCNNRNSASTDQLVLKNTGSHVTGETIATKSRISQFRIDGLSKALENNSINVTDTVVVSAFEFDENVYMYDSDGMSSFVTSKVLRLDVKSDDRLLYPDETTFDQLVQTPEAALVTPEVNDEDASEFMYHTFIYQTSVDHVCMIINPVSYVNNTNSTRSIEDIKMYEVYFSFTEPPSIIEYDFISTVYETDGWVKCIEPSKMNGHTGLTYIGISLQGDKKFIEYNLTIVTLACLVWEEQVTKWHPDKCQATWIPQDNKLSCHCNGVTDMVFANSFFVAPNSIDFSSVFLRFSPLSQAAVMGTLISIYLLYLIGVIILRRLDKADSLKWAITPLHDNIVSDNYFYLIYVYTGMRRGAGTKSSIAFNIKGLITETGSRSLSDGIRPGFPRGSCLSFLMATHAWLGPLHYLSIWHSRDGGEEFPSWYINHVTVYDISKNQTYTFVVEQWLSVETSLYINVQSVNTQERLSFESRFFHRTRDRLAEGHMWASIFYRPTASVFTRVQRLSCAVVYVLLNMIANAMFFNPEPNYEARPFLQVGPFRFSGQEVYVSIISALITTPPIMLLVLLYNRTRPHNDAKSCCSNCFSCSARPSKRRRMRLYDEDDDDEIDDQSGDMGSSDREDKHSQLLTRHSPEFVGKWYFPHRFVYIIWCIVLASMVVPSFFIILFSIEWGKQKSEEWLTSFFLSLIESATVVDPVMLVCAALLLAIITRVQVDVKSVDLVEVIRKYRKIIPDNTDRQVVASPPLGDDSADEVRRQKKHQSELTSSVRDIAMATLFMMLVCSIALSNRDDHSYFSHSEIVNTIVDPMKMPQFSSIQTPGDLYTWLNVSALPVLFPDEDYNGQSLHWTDREFMTGQHNFRLGPPRLRQLRSKKSRCHIPYIGTVECSHKYSLTNEDEGTFCIGWNNRPCSSIELVTSETSDAWVFTSALDIWGLPLSGLHTTYGGGGYIASFAVSRSNTFIILDELYQNIWINRQTRAVLFEFTLYNPGTNLFIYNEFLVEFLETGGALTSYKIYPMRLYNHHGGIGKFSLVCEVLFVFCLFAFLLKISIRFYQQHLQYFKQLWQVFELLMFSTGVVAIVAYFIRLGLTNMTISKFKEDKKRFVNFAHVVLWDQIYAALLGMLVFMATLRILQTFSASKRINSIVTIFNDCGKDLFWFSTCFVYILLGFSFFGLFLFGSRLVSYMSIYRSITTLFLAIIGKSKFTEIEDAQPVLAKIFFSFYILTVVFYIVTIFVSILSTSVNTVIHDTRLNSAEDVIDYMAKTLKGVVKKSETKLGLKRKPEVSYTNVERIYITGSFSSLRSISPTQEEREDAFISSEPAVPVLRPHPFSRFKTTKLKQKMTKGNSVFIAE